MSYQDYNYYHCCFNRINVKDGAIFIGIAELIAVILDAVIFLINGYLASEKNVNVFMIASVFVPLLVMPIVVALMFIGIFKRRPALILPHLVVQILVIVFLLIMASLWIFGQVQTRHVIERAPSVDESIASSIPVFVSIVYIVTLGLQIWFVRIVYKCFLYVQNGFC